MGAMKEIGERFRRCGDECSITSISRMINKVLEGNNVAILVRLPYYIPPCFYNNLIVIFFSSILFSFLLLFVLLDRRNF